MEKGRGGRLEGGFKRPVHSKVGEKSERVEREKRAKQVCQKDS